MEKSCGVAKISLGGKMQKLKEKVDRKRRELEDLILDLAVKAKANDHHPNFHIKEACDNAALGVQKANAELFYAQIALGG
jgi:ribosome maturation protein Sdo1